jgi:capsular exopolysaccharide synthesis family protein
LITSSVPAEGKSFVAANLAQSLARQPKSRVLLIDADLRISQLHYLLGAPNKPGLTDYLRGETDEISIIQMDTKQGFSFIPAGDGVADPSELILGGRMKKLLDLVTPAFNWVILDSPPALAVHDASVLADLCDGVLFVVKAGETTYENAVKASAEFRQKNLLGVVLNQVDKNDFYGTYHYSSAYGSEPK